MFMPCVSDKKQSLNIIDFYWGWAVGISFFETNGKFCDRYEFSFKKLTAQIAVHDLKITTYIRPCRTKIVENICIFWDWFFKMTFYEDQLIKNLMHLLLVIP